MYNLPTSTMIGCKITIQFFLGFYSKSMCDVVRPHEGLVISQRLSIAEANMFSCPLKRGDAQLFMPLTVTHLLITALKVT